MAIAYFGSPISPNQIETAEGYLICKNVPIARTGSQNYLAREMGVADADPEAVIPVMRYPEDVFAPETIASFEGKPSLPSRGCAKCAPDGRAHHG